MRQNAEYTVIPEADRQCKDAANIKEREDISLSY